ncbi:MAG: DNA methyltransferase [Candidatus Methanodesulfokora sp.]|jgi:tRNA (guanine10-N2)-dimethyltransferase
MEKCSDMLGFYLSGEHESLPFSEVKSILEAYGLSYEGEIRMKQLLLIKTDDRAVDLIARRSAYAKEIFSVEKIGETLSDLDVKIRLSKRFRVRCIRIGGSMKEISCSDIERRLGGILLSQNPGSRVDLNNPEEEVVVFLSDMMVVGKSLVKIDRSALKIREVSARPFKHPSSMGPVLARAMVNLSRVKEGDLMLDPFLGAGGIALEALMMGIKVIGIEIDERTAKGAQENMFSYGFSEEDFRIICGDSRFVKLDEELDSIVTDPPYGRGSSLRGERLQDLLNGVLKNVLPCLRRGGYLVISLPHWLNAKDIIENHNLTFVEEHRMKVNRSLSRKIIVLKR